MSTATSTEIMERPTLYAETIRELNRKMLAPEIDEKLMELTKAVSEGGGQGSLSLTLTVKRAGDGEVLVSPKLALKMPAKKAYESPFYVDEHSRLVRDNPKQKQFNLEQKAA